MGDVSTGDVVVDGTQKKVVVYRNYMDLGLVPRLSDGRKPAKEVRWEAKSVFEKMVRWVRERIPREVDSFFWSEELEDEDAERCKFVFFSFLLSLSLSFNPVTIIIQ
jgi:hypothetical protein